MLIINADLSSFIRSEPLTEAEWLDKLEHRRSSINRIIDELPLQRLDHYQCFNGYRKPLNEFDQVIYESPNIMRLRGILNRTMMHEDYESYVYGIDNKGKWLLVGIHCTHGPDNNRAFSVQRFDSTAVAIRNATRLSYRQLWYALGGAIDELLKIRKKQVATIEELSLKFASEHGADNAMQNKS